MHASIRYGLRVGRATVGGGALAAVWGIRAGPGRGGGLDLFGGRGFQFHARSGPEVFIVALMTHECLPPRMPLYLTGTPYLFGALCWLWIDPQRNGQILSPAPISP